MAEGPPKEDHTPHPQGRYIISYTTEKGEHAFATNARGEPLLAMSALFMKMSLDGVILEVLEDGSMQAPQGVDKDWFDVIEKRMTPKPYEADEDSRGFFARGK